MPQIRKTNVFNWGGPTAKVITLELFLRSNQTSAVVQSFFLILFCRQTHITQIDCFSSPENLLHGRWKRHVVVWIFYAIPSSSVNKVSKLRESLVNVLKFFFLLSWLHGLIKETPPDSDDSHFCKRVEHFEKLLYSLVESSDLMDNCATIKEREYLVEGVVWGAYKF